MSDNSTSSNDVDAKKTPADTVMNIPSSESTEEMSKGKGSESVVSTESQSQPTQQQLDIIASNSRVPEIWSNFFQRMEKIDILEMRVNEHVSRSRRRIHNLLEQLPSHRRTHLRMFVSHFFDKFKGIWTISIEGKLLVGNLDYTNAMKVETEGVMSVRGASGEKEEEDGKKNSNLSIASSDNTKSTGTDTAATTTPDRNYRVGEKEEDPIEPPVFTHCFDKLVVTFRTVYQPRVAPLMNSLPQSFAKKSRTNKRKSGQQVQDEPVPVNPKHLKASDPTKLIWNKNDTPDSHAFNVKYNNHFSERPPPPNMKFHSIVAKIELYPSRPGVGESRTQYQNPHDVNDEPLYQIAHPILAKQFSPKHVIEKEKSEDESQTKDEDDNPETNPINATDSNPHQGGPSLTKDDDPIPLENDIRVPSFLTYNEISMSIFQYIQDNKLHDPADRSLIVCDKLLTEIFDVESMNFGSLKQLLIGKKLIRRVGAPSTEEHFASFLSPQKFNSGNPKHEEPVMPVILTYVMNEHTTSTHVPTGFEEQPEKTDELTGDSAALAKRKAAYSFPEDLDHNPTVCSFDMDVSLPSFFNYRARELLRRVKKREFEYTTCRTKARYLLVASKGNEDMIKTRIDRAISGQGYEVENIPVFLALAKAAHPHSEARAAAQIDARTCDIIGRVEEASHSVEASWEAVDALRHVMGGSRTTTSTTSNVGNGNDNDIVMEEAN
jgi:hypothetical protein